MCLYTSFSWMEEHKVVSDAVIIHTLIHVPTNKQKHTHIIGHFLAELFGVSGFRARQVFREQPVKPEGDRELDYKGKEEP